MLSTNILIPKSFPALKIEAYSVVHPLIRMA